MISILFVCTGNSCRSPLAEVLARREWSSLGAELAVSSAGLHASPDAGASVLARELARDNGLDLDEHRARDLDAILLENAELVLTMSEGHKAEILQRHPEARGKVFTLSEFSGLSGSGDVVDPWGGEIDDYRRTFEVLREYLAAASENLRSYLK